jgi:xylulokinase
LTTLLAGLDLGTTGVKVVVVEAGTGTTVARAYRAYPSDTSRADRHEQDPADWWTASAAALREAVAQVDAAAIAGVGLSGHMHAVALFDERDRPVRPAMTWADRRAGAEVGALREQSARIGERTGNPVVEAFSAPKLAWVASHEPESVHRAVRLVLPKDVLRHHLTGGWGTDVTDAAGTLLYDVRQRRWDPGLWELCGADPRLAPDVGESSQIAGAVTAAAADATGLRAGTPVVAGAGDVACAALGAGVVAAGRLYVNVGTAAQIVTTLDEPRADVHRFVFARAGQDGFLGMVSSYAAGLAIRWCEQTLLGGGPDGTADRLALISRPGAGGLTFLPYLLGASAPIHDPGVRAALLGAGPQHGPGDIARAALEGVAYACAAAVDQLLDGAPAATDIRVGGGVTRSPVWCEAFAAVSDAPVRRLRQDASPRGAVVLAGVGTGVWPDVAAACAVLDDSEPLAVADPHRDAYRAARRRYDAAAGAVAALSDRRGDAGGAQDPMNHSTEDR